MTEVTVEKLAKIVGTPAEKMLMQMKEAGLKQSSPLDSVTDRDKKILLVFLKDQQRKSSKTITLKKKPSLEEFNKGTTIEIRRKNIKSQKIENEIPEDSKNGILKGMYLFKEFNNKGKIKIQLLGCGAILREILAAAEVLSKEYNIDSDVWSVTSFNELRKDGMETERKNLLNPGEKPEKSYVEKCLDKREGPIIAASDYIRTFADQIRPYLSKPFYSFGTDGYGRSDSRKKLRRFFEVDKEYIVTYALSALAKEQLIPSKHAEKAMKKYNINKDKPIPTEL